MFAGEEQQPRPTPASVLEDAATNPHVRKARQDRALKAREVLATDVDTEDPDATEMEEDKPGGMLCLGAVLFHYMLLTACVWQVTPVPLQQTRKPWRNQTSLVTFLLLYLFVFADVIPRTSKEKNRATMNVFGCQVMRMMCPLAHLLPEKFKEKN